MQHLHRFIKSTNIYILRACGSCTSTCLTVRSHTAAHQTLLRSLDSFRKWMRSVQRLSTAPLKKERKTFFTFSLFQSIKTLNCLNCPEVPDNNEILFIYPSILFCNALIDLYSRKKSQPWKMSVTKTQYSTDKQYQQQIFLAMI